MKKQLITLMVFLLATVFSGCAVVEGIFKAGMGVGILLVVVVIALVIFLITRMGKKNS